MEQGRYADQPPAGLAPSNQVYADIKYEIIIVIYHMVFTSFPGFVGHSVKFSLRSLYIKKLSKLKPGHFTWM